MSTEDNKPQGDAPPAGSEADFADLLQQASELEGRSGPQGGKPLPAGAAPVDPQAQQLQIYSTQLLAALQMLRVVGAKGLAWWEDFGQVWGDPTLQSIATSWAAICVQHDIDLDSLMGRYMPYVAAGFATLPPCWMTYQAIKERREQLERAKAAGKGAANGGDQQAAH